ncbi:hypothetical protein ACHAXT_005338 [Thalassiosira profunda]
MGHTVSTPRRESHGRRNAAVAISLAILVAVAAASAEVASANSCYVASRAPWLPSAHATHLGTSATSSLRATSTSTAIAASVPPPNSRLGRLRQRSRSSSLQQPPGTKRSQRKGKGGSPRSSDLGYATHGSHYAQYTGTNSDDDGEPIWRGFSLRPANAMEEAGEGGRLPDAVREAPEAVLSEGPDAPTLAYKQQGKVTNSKRKRARMIRFIDNRLGRQSKAASKSKSSTDRRLVYEERKAAWAAKYTSVHTLRKSFGKNKNRIWGDYDPTSTRKLYHTLLPKALLELRGLRDGLLSNRDEADEVDEKKKSRQSARALSDTVVDDGIDSYLQQELKELAPLAYQARLAAKKYARERSRLPGRIGSMLYDGYRSWRRYGKWKSTGMTWEQVWNKYEDQVLREAREELEDAEEATWPQLLREDLDDEELTARICLRILERSVVTNEAIDRLFLERLAEAEEESANDAREANQARRRRQGRQPRRKLQIQADLQAIEKKFDDDIQELLRYSNLITREGEERRGKRRGAFFWKRDSGAASLDADSGRKMAPSTADTAAAAFARGGGGESATASESDDLTATASEEDEKGPSSSRKLAVEEVFALRMLANTKQRISSLQSSPQLDNTDEDDQ